GEHGRHLVLADVEAFAEAPGHLPVDATLRNGLPVAEQAHVGRAFALLRVFTLELESELDATGGQRVARDHVVARAEIRPPHCPDLQTFNPLFPRGAYFSQANLLGPLNHVDLHPALSLKPVRGL